MPDDSHTTLSDLAGPDLAAMIGSRICHDLISPVGAISNGVELLGMAGGTEGPELSLITESVANANARIRFFRVAFGHASPGQQIGSSEIKSILTDLYATGRLGVTWMPTEDLDRAEVRLACLAILCLESALPYGGEIRVFWVERQWMIVGEGKKTKQDEAIWSTLGAGLMPEVTAKEVHFALLPQALDRFGRTIKVERVPERVVITF